MTLTENGIEFHVVTVLSLLTFKLAVLAVGYLIARLGHDLLIKGVSGEFKFRSEFKGAKADLISASPGIFFILMATVLIAIGVIKDKPFNTTTTTTTVSSTGETVTKNHPSDSKPALPSDPSSPIKP